MRNCLANHDVSHVPDARTAGLSRQFHADVPQEHSRQLFFEKVIIERQDVRKNARAVEQNQPPQDEREQNETKANRTFRVGMLDLVAPDHERVHHGLK